MVKIDKNKDNYISDVLDCNGNVLTTTQEEMADSSKSVCYAESVEVIRNSINRIQELSVVIGFNLKKIKENKLYLVGGYKNIYEFAEAEFSLSKSTAIRLMNVCKYFSKGNNSSILDERYAGFSTSQLFELLPMSPEQRNIASPDMTVTQLRRLKEGKTKESLPEKSCEVQGISAMSHQSENTDIFPTEEEEQHELPCFNTKEECMVWLQDVEAWGVWYEDFNIQARYFKYDFYDGSRLIAVKYRYTCPPFMRDEPELYKEQLEADGRYYGPAYYHMIYSESYWEDHLEEYKTSFRRYYATDTDPVDSLADFLMKLQSVEKESDAYTWAEIEFDADHLEEDDIKALPSKARQYALFYKEHNYIPRFFNIKDRREIIDYAPTLLTSSGSFGGIGAVSIFDLSKNVMNIVDDETLSYAEKGQKIKMLMNIACPEEKQKMAQFLGTQPGWEKWMSGFGGGKVKFFIRKYTTEQVFELMGMRKSDVERCRAVGVSDTQLFRQAGNGIVTNVVQELSKSIYKAQWT